MANSYYQRKATIDAINAKKPEALKRDAQTDYTTGCFFVTLNVRDHKPLLGTITGHLNHQTQQANDVNVHLSQLGELVRQTWQTIPEYHPNVHIIDSVVMPEHFHGLLRLEHIDGVTLSSIIRGFKLGCNHAYRELCAIDSATLFSSGFNETIPITPDEIETKKQYIHDNPHRRFIKDHFRDCFTICRNQHSPNWTTERIIQGICKDKFLAQEDALQTTLENLQPRLLRDESGHLTLDYIGSQKLLSYPNKLSLICHRADAEHFAEQSEVVLRAAKDGAVIVSPFISRCERELLNQLIEIGSPIIEIVDNGFGKTYKPWGNSFYACAESKLLQITCWNYLYQRDATVTRPMCMVMNELARLISGVEDGWWKKLI